MNRSLLTTELIKLDLNNAGINIPALHNTSYMIFC